MMQKIKRNNYWHFLWGSTLLVFPLHFNLLTQSGELIPHGQPFTNFLVDAVQTVIVENGEMKPGHVMKVTLSCDHRVVDGVTGAKFLQTFQELLEEPVRLLVQFKLKIH